MPRSDPAKAAWKVGFVAHLYGHPSLRGPVTAIKEDDGVSYAKFRCEVHKRETGWLRFDQLRGIE